MEDEGDKRKIQELQEVERTAAQVQEIEEKYRGSETELKTAKEETEEWKGEGRKEEGGVEQEISHLKKMKASLGLIQSLRTERKHSRKSTRFWDKAAKHLAQMEKSRNGRDTKRVGHETKRWPRQKCVTLRRKGIKWWNQRGSEQEQAAHAETLRTN